uniref:Arrestin_C domain-containing protein n=1 Tax=Schistocephalus solidus TaxID=70667 RepID=A0A183TAV2_SCHSO
LGTIEIDVSCGVDGIGWRLMHENRFPSVEAKSEVVTGGSEEVHAPLHFLFCRCIECAVISEEKLVDGGCGYTDAPCFTPLVTANASDTVPLSVTRAALLHSVGHCKCFGYRPVVSNARHHPVVKLTHHMREPLRTAEFLHDFPQPVAIRQIHEVIYCPALPDIMGSPHVAYSFKVDREIGDTVAMATISCPLQLHLMPAILNTTTPPAQLPSELTLQCDSHLRRWSSPIPVACRTIEEISEAYRTPKPIQPPTSTEVSLASCCTTEGPPAPPTDHQEYLTESPTSDSLIPNGSFGEILDNFLPKAMVTHGDLPGTVFSLSSRPHSSLLGAMSF